MVSQSEQLREQICEKQYLLVEPVNLGVDEIRGNESLVGEELLDLGSLVSFALKNGVGVSSIISDNVIDGGV